MPPTFTQPDLPRYSERLFPAYRYLPFQTGDAALPHPRRDKKGHSYGKRDDYLPQFAPEDWCRCEPYLYGIDLFNHGYWWEAHEALETVWLAAGGSETDCGRFVQGLIQLAAAQLKRFIGQMSGAQMLTESACEKLERTEEIYLGIDAKGLIAIAQRCLQEDSGQYPSIALQF